MIDLKKLRFEHQLTQDELGKILGVSKQQISNIETGKSDLTDENKRILSKKFDLNLQSQIFNQENYVSIDYYPDVFGSCGHGAFVLSEQKELIQVPQKIFNHFSTQKNYSVINTIGESMLPTLRPKDKLIVEHWQGEQIKDNQVYVFCYKDEIFVKRLIKNIDELIVKSDNPDPMYRPRYIEKEDMNNVLIVGEIVGLMRDMR